MRSMVKKWEKRTCKTCGAEFTVNLESGIYDPDEIKICWRCEIDPPPPGYGNPVDTLAEKKGER